MTTMRAGTLTSGIVYCLSRSGLGGGQQVAWMLAKDLAERGAGPFAVILPAGGEYVERFRGLGIRVIEFPADRIRPWSIVRMGALLSQLRPDVVHSHGKGAGFYVRLQPRWLVKGRRIHSFHGFHPPGGYLLRRLYTSAENFLGKRTDAVVAVSQSEADEIAGSLPVLSDRLAVIPNIVDCAAVKAATRKQLTEPLQSFLDKRAGSFLVTMIARNDPIKNHRLAFDACRLVLSERRDVTAVFVGTDERDRHLASLQNEFPDAVKAVPSLENALPLIERSTLLMLTSRREGSPLVLLEGLCLGVPAVGTNVPGIRDVIRDQETGILCDQTARAVAKAIGTIIGDPAFREALSRRAAGSVRMTIGEWSERYLEVYRGGSGRRHG